MKNRLQLLRWGGVNHPALYLWGLLGGAALFGLCCAILTGYGVYGILGGRW